MLGMVGRASVHQDTAASPVASQGQMPATAKNGRTVGQTTFFGNALRDTLEGGDWVRDALCTDANAIRIGTMHHQRHVADLCQNPQLRPCAAVSVRFENGALRCRQRAPCRRQHHLRKRQPPMDGLCGGRLEVRHVMSGRLDDRAIELLDTLTLALPGREDQCDHDIHERIEDQRGNP